MRSHYLVAFPVSIILSLLHAGFLSRTPVWGKFTAPERDDFVQGRGFSLHPASLILRATAGAGEAPAPPSLGTLWSWVLVGPLRCAPTLTTHPLSVLAEIHTHGHLSLSFCTYFCSLIVYLLCGWAIPSLFLLFVLIRLVFRKRGNAGFMLPSLNLKTYCLYTKLY